MHATTLRRFVSHPKAALAVAIGIVIAGIVIVASLALSTSPSQTVASVESPPQAQSLNKYEHMMMLEENTRQIPYTVPRAVAFEGVDFNESNTFQVPYVAPVLTGDTFRLMEENTLGYYAPVAASSNDATCSSEYIVRIQQGCKNY